MISRITAAGAALAGGATALAVSRAHDRLLAVPDHHRGREVLDLAGPARFVESADGTPLRVIELGPSHGPLTLLVHGFVSTAAAWSLVAPRLAAAGRRVVVMEQRAHGASGLGHGGLSLLHLGDDLAAVIESLDNRHDGVTLVGHSMGTIAAFAMAIRRPEVLRGQVERFVGASALHRGRGKPRGLELKKYVLYTKAYDWARRQRALGVVCTRSALGPHAGYTLTEATYNMYLEAGPDVIEHFGRELLTFDFGHVLSDFAVPTTLLVGSADVKTPPRLARELADGLPDAKVIELPDVGHMTPLETPDAIVDAVLN
ncbi:MAG: alpha/beta hydrolase [Actinomycetota bacterium]|jgi:non-heme chloroperoxidase|nr:alpha/beta hydrolase [Actinomycetota bacterium]